MGKNFVRLFMYAVQFSSTDVSGTCAKNSKETLFINRGVVIALEGVAGDHDWKVILFVY